MLILALAAPVTILLVETVAAFLPDEENRENLPPSLEEMDCVVLIPAHNEEKVIGRTLSALEKALGPSDRVLVVLDNCDDGTKEAVASHRVDFVERKDPEKRGKGYALEFGFRSLKDSPPRALVVLDADCIPNEGFLVEIKKALVTRNRPVQALNLMKAPPGSPPLCRVSEFAWLFKCSIRQRGLERLGLPCHLQGTGMGFLWEHLEGVDLGGAELAEDMKLGVELAEKGRPACFHPKAEVVSYFPSRRESSKIQRRRWEHGHLGLILRKVPAFLLKSLFSGDFRSCAFAMDMAVPPLAFLALLLGSALVAAGILAATGDRGPILAAAGETVLFSGTVILAWWKEGRKILTFKELLATPIYIASKMGLYLGFFLGKETSWVRTDRE